MLSFVTLDNLCQSIKSDIDTVGILSYFVPFKYFGYSLDNIELFIVKQDYYDDLVFTKVKGKIVKNKLDKGYINSQIADGLGLDSFNTMYKITTKDTVKFTVEELGFDALKKELNDIYEPSHLTYAIVLPTSIEKINIDKDILDGMDVETLVSALNSLVQNQNELAEKIVALKKIRCNILDFE